MIYCNFTDKDQPASMEIVGNGVQIRDELAAIFIELLKTGGGERLIHDAFHQSVDPAWREIYDKEIRDFPDPNGKKHEYRN